LQRNPQTNPYKKLISSSIKNLLLDLGGVIIDIEPIRVAQSFAGLSSQELSWVRYQIEAKQLFYKYETGAWTDDEFRRCIKQLLDVPLTDEQIDYAWNSMLLNIPQERIDLLLKLRKQYNLYLLSNTNAIHIHKVNTILQKQAAIADLETLFDKTYYSHQIGHSKPSLACYRYVLNDCGALPQETLFIDDNADNIAGAKQLGIQTVLIQPPVTLIDLFH